MAEVKEIRLYGPEQRALFAVLKQNGGDVHIDTLFEAVDGPAHVRSPRQRQQWLGSYLTRLNRRLRPYGIAVRPGDLKRTYRLNVV